MLINDTKESFQMKIGKETVNNSKDEKLRMFKVDPQLKYNEHDSRCTRRLAKN